MNQWIGQKEQWSLAELEERDQLLKNQVIEIWTYPVSSYQPKEKQMDSASLDEDVILLLWNLVLDMKSEKSTGNLRSHSSKLPLAGMAHLAK